MAKRFHRHLLALPVPAANPSCEAPGGRCGCPGGLWRARQEVLLFQRQGAALVVSEVAAGELVVDNPLQDVVHFVGRDLTQAHRFTQRLVDIQDALDVAARKFSAEFAQPLTT